MRKIKTFNVDEDVYNGLLSMFKKYEINASLSSFVNNCLIEVLSHIQEVEALKQKHPDYKVPMSFVISEMTKSLGNKKTMLPLLMISGTKHGYQELYDDLFLTKWEDEYEAQKLGIPVEMYFYIKEGGYLLAPNKQYLIHEKTGKKFIAVRSEKGLTDVALLEIKEG